MNLLERIDIALQHARKSRGDLATGIGLSTQAISNLKRRPGSSLKPEHVAKAARFMGCDIYWLCTGEGGKYVSEATMKTGTYSFIASEIARWVDDLSDVDRARAFELFYRMSKGDWPMYPPTSAPPAAEQPLRRYGKHRPE